MKGDDVPLVMVVVSYTYDADVHYHRHMMVRKEQTAGSALGNYENRVSVSYAVSLRNCLGFVPVILTFDRVLVVSVAIDLLVVSDR